jgi:prepilin peptidase CpaA
MSATVSHLVSFAPLLALLTWAAVEDWRTRRIRNWLTLTLAVTGLVQSFTPVRTVGPLDSALGLAVGFTLPFAMFVIGAVRGGDVKLMAGAGAWLGWKGILLVFVLEKVVGLAIVLAQCAAAGRLGELMRNTRVLAVELLNVRHLGAEHVAETGRTFRSIDRPLPYAVPVLVATLLVLYLFTRGVPGGRL